LVWGYALIWFLINNVLKVYLYRLIRHQFKRQARHLQRIQANLHSHPGERR
jgi:H+-transporting ATPase